MNRRRKIRIIIALSIVAALAVAAGVWLFISRPEKGVECHDATGYFVVVRAHTDSVGSDILVKRKESSEQRLACRYSAAPADFELRSSEAEYYAGIASDFLVTDVGTAPSPRTMNVYDLASRKEAFSGMYSKPLDIATDTVSFWKPIDLKPTKANCPDLVQYTANGLGAGIEAHTALNLADMTQKDLGERRCAARQ